MLLKTANSIMDKALSFIHTWDPKGYDSLVIFKDRRIGLKLEGLAPLVLQWDNNTYRIHIWDEISDVDLICECNPSWLMAFFISRDLEARQHLKLHGDILFAHALERSLHHLDLQWGDVFSHALGDRYSDLVFRGLSTCHKHLSHQPQALAQSLSDYLCYEAGIIVSAPELSHFYQEVDTLVHDVERLEQQLQRLKESLC